MPTNLQGRTEYLSLALFSQSVVSALLDFVDQDKSERLESSLREALGSLEDIVPPRLEVENALFR
jgi:hypothetical protein